ncbi:MAG: 23S rRNA (pseudouridine(1915)-N(3))-methyltransferase RlmH [Candidatus Woesearchaeota archaeon]|nr:23S rRNA (pseudouridine(1915)-N(3))-methyltransferase RlmH [Candidatus Woesearchaeota archaeon]
MIKIICLGTIRDGHISGLITEYLQRLERFVRVEVIEVPDQKIEPDTSSDSKAADMIRELEGRKILKILESQPRACHTIILDEHGTLFSSEQLAERIKAHEVDGDILFIIGGALGLSPEVKKKANLTLSLSRMTFAHGLCRLFLVEQIYRAYTIIKGMPYHK